tara:strand:+ start:23199 stop:26246 length:3048 start_codon:yes stop_codon:yes gene_type:complete
MPISAEDGGIRIRGPKSTDAFPYDRYGPITGNDTLWNIALKVRPDPRLSVYQVMQALFENNPDSFKDSNLNHMINGQYLKIPSIEVMRAISTANAQQKSRSDDKAWQKKVVKVVAKKVRPPEEASVNKKDLDAAKSEINVQLKAIDNTQQQRLATIQNDVLDSIDGLQSLLKENEALRQRLGSFNEQLDVMQSEVAKSKEIKIQMDSMIALQQELLAKAEAREQALLLEKQKAELEDSSFMSSTWFVALMATLPALLLLSLIAILLRRRSNKDNDVSVVAAKKEKVTESEPEAKVAATAEQDSVDNELLLEDEVSLDSELSLDDELSIDLSEVDDEHDDLFSDDLGSLDDELLDDDVIQLDDELADLDDLEDISLDDDLETLSLDEDIVESDALEGGQLDQSDLDSLFAGLEDETSTNDDTIDILDSDLVEQGDLDGLLSENELVTSENTDLLNKPEDIDALLNAADEANNDVSDPDDIDALLDAVVAENNDVSDPDDIDALLDAAVEENHDVSDPDDIDALLDAAAEENNNVSDPDDIDALLDAAVEENNNVSDPDDIDALLASINTENDTPEPETTSAKDPDPEANVDVSDPDDIDALLASINAENDTPEPETTSAKDPDAEANVDVSDPDDIDALLDSINAEDDAPEPEATSAKGAAVEDISETDSESRDDESTEDENTQLINNFSDEYVKSFIDADFSELLNEFVDEAETSAAADSIGEVDENEGISDDFDIDALIDEVNDTPQVDDEAELDIGDDLLSTEITDDELLSEDDESESLENKTADIDDETLQALSGDFDESTLSQLLNDEKEVDSTVELSPDFTDSNVLADLLAEDSYVAQQAKGNKEEVDGIKELDNLDFDDLLANIEEETSTSSNDEFEFNENFEIGDDFDSDIVDDIKLDGSDLTNENDERDFISVDSLLSDSLLDGKPTEPYEKMNIDVGLGEFPEFSGNISEDDIDDDDNGIAAKLDLAKVYLEIGDNENAEVILLDVVKQGDAQQQFDAQQLLDNIK